MEVCFSLLLTGMLLSLMKMANGLECYHCHQTSTECINGVKRHLQTIHCTESKCFVLQYETDMPGVTVRATYRGCYSLPEDELMKTVVTENHAVRKKHFHLCNYTQCNGTSSRSYLLLQFVICIVHFVIFFF